MSELLIGPIHSVLTMNHLPNRGSLKDEQLEIIPNAGIKIANGKIEKIAGFESLARNYQGEIQEISSDCIAVPGMIDAHTHICYAGNRINDYALRQSGKTYLEIAQQGGGIRNTVNATRAATSEQLFSLTKQRLERQLAMGITTTEIKSGYGLNVETELKQLTVLQMLQLAGYEVVPTCLAAHVMDKAVFSDESLYLDFLLHELLPEVKQKNLSHRVDIFIEKSAFSIEAAKNYLRVAKQMGFQFTIHADQFTSGGGLLGIEMGATSVDHLECTNTETIKAIAQSETVAVALPGASLGLGEPFTPVRKLLDAGATVAVASDWNPGSAPMGNLVMQTAVLGAYEKMTVAEMLASVTVRAALALRLNNRGTLAPGMRADIALFETSDYRDLFYQQGMLKPKYVYQNGKLR